jgi:hypothetical protein
MAEEMVYWQGYISDLESKVRDGRPLETETDRQLVEETRWAWTKDLPKASTPAQGEDIGLGRISCPWCGRAGNDRYIRDLIHTMRGETYGLLRRVDRQCFCEFYRQLISNWNKMVPQNYRQFRLNKIAPHPSSRLSLQDQAVVIAALKEAPDRSYLFVGPAKTSKTVFSTALFSNALRDWAYATYETAYHVQSCWRISAFDFLKQAHEYVIQREQTYQDEEGNTKHRTAAVPLVTPEKVKAAAKAGLVPRLFLEEIDKLPKITEFRGSSMFELVNAISESGGQLVTTSNLSIPDLMAMYSSVDGEALIRRLICENSAGPGKVFDFFKAKIAPLELN